MDVITFGETMVLFVPDETGPLRYVQNFQKTIGGAESNVAIGLARLGHEVGWFSRLGNDEFGLYVRNYIRGEGVDTSRTVLDSEFPTGVFFKQRQANEEPRVFYYRKGSAASQMSEADLDENYLKGAKYLYVTGITPALSLACFALVNAAVQTAKKHGLQVVFDPNIRLKLWSKEAARQTLLAIAAQSDIVLAGYDEGRILTGSQSAQEMATRFLELGAKTVVIKLGKDGAYYRSVREEGQLAAEPMSLVVDPIGAGDAFAAGFLSGLLREWELPQAVKLGNKVAAYALTVKGDVEGLPMSEQIFANPDEEVILR